MRKFCAESNGRQIKDPLAVYPHVELGLVSLFFTKLLVIMCSDIGISKSIEVK